MRIEIRRLHQRLDTTTIYVTHDQIEAMTMGDRIVVMRDGVVQQIDTPEQVYRHPRNMFVAGFIGSPPMNFVEGRLAGTGDAVYFDGEAFRLRLGGEAARSVAPRLGQSVYLGVRPAHLHPLNGGGGGAGNTFTARLEALDLIGDEMQLHLTAGDASLVAIFPAEERPEAGQEIPVAVDMARIHLFDARTQDALV